MFQCYCIVEGPWDGGQSIITFQTCALQQDLSFYHQMLKLEHRQVHLHFMHFNVRDRCQVNSPGRSYASEREEFQPGRSCTNDCIIPLCMAGLAYIFPGVERDVPTINNQPSRSATEPGYEHRPYNSQVNALWTVLPQSKTMGSPHTLNTSGSSKRQEIKGL